MSGWVKLHRKTTKWEWYSDHNVTRLFFHLLLKANHKETNWRGSTVNPGQLITGRIQLADETGLSEQQIRTALNKLKSTSEITIKPTNKYSLITITSWSEHQIKDDVSTSKTTNNQPTSNQQVTTSKNVKKEKKEYSEPFLEFWKLYPNKKSKEGAYKAFKKTNGTPIEDILLGLDKYIKGKEDWKAWQHPATWLNGKCWEDEYENTKRGGSLF